MVFVSLKKDSGKPAFFPTQSRPESVERGVVRVVGPIGIGVVEPGVLVPDKANIAGELLTGSMGKARGSLSLPTIQRCTRLIYWAAGTLTGFL